MLLFMPVDHYENFPVASWLMPSHLRPAIRAIYAFARSADDFADEGDRSDSERLALLKHYQDGLDLIDQGLTPEDPILSRLAEVIRHFSLTTQPFRDLLDAFMQDIQVKSYENEALLLDYCRRSANPVGRILLSLWKRDSDKDLLAASDAICTALQQINFLQDIAIDAEKNRCYLPLNVLRSGQVSITEIVQLRIGSEPAPSPALRAVILSECAQYRQRMLSGAHLPKRLGGRIGSELSLVVAGGLRILDKIEACHGDIVFHRPQISSLDYLPIVWRAWVVGF